MPKLYGPDDVTAPNAARLPAMLRPASAVALALACAVLAAPAYAQDAVGGVSSPQGAMIFYHAGGQDACGPGCSEWIAAEGVVEWDTYKRLFAFFGRFGERKLPIVLNSRGEGALNVATTLGKIIRDHGLDVSAGTTVVADCAGVSDAACVALKRSGKPLKAAIDTTAVQCDIVCVLILAGGVHRSLPAGAKVIVEPTHIANRLAPNVSAEQQKGLQTVFGDQYRLYLKQMGVSTEVADILERSTAANRAIQLSPADWQRLGIVTPP